MFHRGPRRLIHMMLCLVVVACGTGGERVLSEEQIREGAELYRDAVFELAVTYAPLDSIGEPSPGGGVHGLADYVESASDAALVDELLGLCDVLDSGSPAAARAEWEADAFQRFGIGETLASVFSLIPVMATVWVCPEHGERVIEYGEGATG